MDTEVVLNDMDTAVVLENNNNEKHGSGSSMDTQLEIQRLHEMVRSLQQEVNMLKRSAKTHRDFVVAQYNILAGYLGDNRQPWFLYGIPMSAERRATIFAKFYEKDPTTKRYKNVGWPTYVQGILSKEEQATIEQIHTNYFDWNERKFRIVDEIQSIDADLVSLVECDNYNDFFKPKLYRLGYSSIYKQRPRKCSNDGCAIFYKHGVFSLEVWQGVEFTEETTTTNGTASVKKINKDRVGLIALFQHLSGRKVIFISTHLARNPEDNQKTTIRISQVAQLLYQLTKFALEYNVMNVPVILAGDMNATNIRQVAGVARIVFELSCEAAHPFIYNSFSPRSSPTSVSSCRKVCIDYLLIQSRHLEIIDTYEMDRISPDNPIPNQKHPSDHLPLVFRIGFKKHSLMMQEFAKAWTITLLHAQNKGNATVATLQPEMLFMQREELYQAFCFFDINDSEEISYQELASCLNELRMTEFFTDILHVVYEQLYKNKNNGIEINSSNGKLQDQVEKEEEDTTKGTRKQQQKRIVRSSFGSLTISDHAIDIEGKNDEKEEEEESFNMLLQQQISLTFDDFVKVYTNCVLMQKNYFRDQFLITDTVYSYFDMDQSGELEFEELYTTFSNVCPFEVSNQAFEELFHKLDVDNSGTITMDELFDYLVKNRCYEKNNKTEEDHDEMKKFKSQKSLARYSILGKPKFSTSDD